MIETLQRLNPEAVAGVYVTASNTDPPIAVIFTIKSGYGVAGVGVDTVTLYGEFGVKILDLYERDIKKVVKVRVPVEILKRLAR